MGGNELITLSAFKGTRNVGLDFLASEPSDLPVAAVPSVNSEVIETKLVLRILPEELCSFILVTII